MDFLKKKMKELLDDSDDEKKKEEKKDKEGKEGKEDKEEKKDKEEKHEGIRPSLFLGLHPLLTHGRVPRHRRAFLRSFWP